MQEAAKLIFNPTEKYRLESRMWQGVPGIEKTGERLWATWFSGGKYEPCIHNYGILAYGMVIFLSNASGVLLLKEKFKKQQIIGVIIGAVSVILLADVIHL